MEKYLNLKLSGRMIFSSRAYIFSCFCMLIILATGCSVKLSGDLVIKNVTVINVTDGSILNHRDVVINKDRISKIVAHKKNTTYLTKELFDGKEKYIIPGLWDMHTHSLWAYENFFPMLTLNGITGIREMWGDLSDLRKIRNKIDSGLVTGPDIISAGTILDGNPPLFAGLDSTNSPDKARASVRKQKAKGADFIKVYSFLERDVYFAIADECKKLGIPFSGHIPLKISLEEAVAAGQSSVEHFFGILDYCSSESAFLNAAMTSTQKNDSFFEARKFSTFLTRMKFETETFDQSKLSSLVALLSQSDLWLCPTLITTEGSINRSTPNFKPDHAIGYMPDYTIEGWQLIPDSTRIILRTKNLKIETDWYNLVTSLFRQLKDGGVKFLAGTDFPNPNCYPGFSLHDELNILVEKCGFTPLESLQTATINPAVFLQIENDFGTIESGKIANLLILRANPLENINNTKHIEAVIQRGKYYWTNTLQDSLDVKTQRSKSPGN